MRPLAPVDVNDLGSIFQWLISQWWVWVVVGVVVLFFLVVWLLPDAKVKPSVDHPTTGTEANEIALGFLQIHNLPSGPWNDPTASGLGDRERRQLAEQWGILSRQDWLDNIERLLTARRRREPWAIQLAVRDELARRLGRTPKAKEWIAAIVEAGGDKREARAFVTAVESTEQAARKAAGKGAIPADAFVRTFDGYAIGQAVAVATWGVGIGLGTVEEARQLIHRVNAEARPAFSSWVDFGLSYVAGRVMHWSDGRVDEKAFEKWGGDAARDLGAALSAKRQGPWASLPWTL